MANFVLLGTYLKATGVLPDKLVAAEIEKRFQNNKEIMKLNIAAFEAGLKE